ncbi:NAD(P)/FAD-dependent oxidoreductase [Oceanicoccus sp. KOV_DT_Chl]|uniref:flavin-containing monooxygenase n=1 Tax=Oceanicoccus sp. KOV_DT_Chl TaxID=1904639 RepID=UPI000C7B7F8F|nr:NAD(P)/FAD-dependent oxidoreductase [Oceanicoccus sp. KOV_DT_Chl]
MSQKVNPAGIPFTDDDATIEAALSEASVPTLLLTMIHMTGDASILQGSLRPAGVYLNEFQGFMSPEDQTAVRAQALEVIKAYRDGGCQLPPPPSKATIHEMMKFLVVEDVAEEYVPMLLEELELDGEDRREVNINATVECKQQFPVVVIGGGMSGVLAAIRLEEAGIPYTVIEKNPAVGGTWYENTYPGARVDVGNHFYCYSFEPGHEWSQFFSRQPELQTYFQNCAEKYGVLKHFRFNTEVVSARYSDSSQRWSITIRLQDGSTEMLDAAAVISAVGQLNRPNFPDIAGMDTFAGPSFHSAQWRHDVDLSGKKVAVLGSGASAFQLVPEIAKDVEHLTVFQRTPPWMFENPSYHDAVGEGKKWCLKHLPYYARWFRFLIFWPACDGAWPTITVDPEWPNQDRSINEINDIIRDTFTQYIAAQVGDDEDLLAKVIPDYAPLGKRTLQDNGSWLAALKRDNVDLVNEAVATVNAQGLITESGDQYDVDVIIYASGFKGNQFLWPMEITGKNGVSLQQQWGEDAEAYLGITVPNFPNFFCLFGPGTNLAFGGSLIQNSECEMRYIMGCLKAVLESGSSSIECKQSVCDDYNRRLREIHATMVWEHPSIKRSFYQNSKGHATLLSPWKILDFWRWTQQPDLAEFEVR